MFHIHQSSHATAPELSHTDTTSQSEHSAQASLLNPLSFGNDNKVDKYLSLNSLERDLYNRADESAPCMNHNRSKQPQFLELQVSINHTLPIIPGSNKFLIGVDMLQQLGLLTSDRLVILLDEERRTLLNAEAIFDNRIKTHQIGHVESTSCSEEDFTQQLDRSGCEINLDDSEYNKSLSDILAQYKDVFSEKPNMLVLNSIYNYLVS
ncbi:hypothetical protein P9112_009177 [Eukaryota sp. TZLM1-RC]